MNFRWRASALGALVGTILVLGGCSLSQSPLSPGAPAGNPGTSTPPPIGTWAIILPAEASETAISLLWQPLNSK